MTVEIGVVTFDKIARGCATCGATWNGTKGDDCPNCGETKQCQCKHCVEGGQQTNTTVAVTPRGES